MAVPIWCRVCRDIIGVESTTMTLARVDAGYFVYDRDVECSGKGSHPEAERTERARFRGLFKEVTKNYPQTDTTSSWVEYTGPPSKSLLCLAIIVARWAGSDTSGVLVNGKWAWWSRKSGLYGDGVAALTPSEQ